MKEEIRSVALVLAGALLGSIPSVLVLSLSTEVIVGSATTLGIIGLLLLLYGIGIPQNKYRNYILSHRWKEPLKIGILYDMGWDVNNKEIYAWSDVNPDDWKKTLEKFAEDCGIKVKPEFINVGMKFDSYTAILNPYGGVYPELDLGNLSTLDKIVDYAKEGGLFINVADIPSYWAYSPVLHRRLDITSPIYAAFPTTTGLGIVSTKPFELTPLMKKLGLRVVRNDAGIQQDLSRILRANVPTTIRSERLAIVESNVDTCIPTSRLAYVDGNTYDMSALFFVKYGEGEFLFSLIWINTSYHNQQAKDAIRNAISKLTIDKLALKITK